MGEWTCQTQTLYKIYLHKYCGHDISMSDFQLMEKWVSGPWSLKPKLQTLFLSTYILRGIYVFRMSEKSYDTKLWWVWGVQEGLDKDQL